MSCIYSSYSVQIKDFRGNLVPLRCGKCFTCRLLMQSDLVNRMFCAYSCYSTSAFVTFTYNDDNLRFKEGFRYPTLSKDDLHKYLDNIKHQLKNRNIEYEYFACGEYGDSFQRPHYHILFFGLDYQLFQKYFEKTWKYGTVKVLPCDSSSFRYVTKYLTKQDSRSDSEYFDLGRIPPFFKYSRGLGSKVYVRYTDEITKNGYFSFKGKKIYVNTYYFNKYSYRNQDTLLRRQLMIEDREREISCIANNFNMSKDLYKIVNAYNLEKNLTSSCIRKNSSLK